MRGRASSMGVPCRLVVLLVASIGGCGRLRYDPRASGVDAGSATDAWSAMDAGSATDAWSAIDAGSATDAGSASATDTSARDAWSAMDAGLDARADSATITDAGVDAVCFTEPPARVACPSVYDPVCGCDGVDYPNSCEASNVGIAVAFRGTCAGGET